MDNMPISTVIRATRMADTFITKMDDEPRYADPSFDSVQALLDHCQNDCLLAIATAYVLGKEAK